MNKETFKTATIAKINRELDAIDYYLHHDHNGKIIKFRSPVMRERIWACKLQIAAVSDIYFETTGERIFDFEKMEVMS